MDSVYNRVILKLSGEVFAGDNRFGVDSETVAEIGKYIKKMLALNVEIGVVIGGGNFWRGRTSQDMDRVTADYMGMLATVMNALAMSDSLRNLDVPNVVMSTINVSQITLPHNKNEALRHMSEGKVVVFGGGGASPFFSTDTTAALRAAEIEADAILLAKNIDGIYDSDPKLNPDAIKFTELSYSDILNKKLKALDMTASVICMENDIVTQVFDLNKPENILKALAGENVGTIIKEV